MRSRSRVGFLFLTMIASALGGCARTRPALPGADCYLSAPPSGPGSGGEIIVQLGESVEAAHAPMPANDAEAIVFRQLYETLTEVDCDGNLRGGLAERWDSDAEARTWTLTLEPRRFWDGSGLRSEDVVASWRTSALRASSRVPWCWIDPANVTAIDSRRLEIRLRDPMPDLPRVLAHSSLAVASPRPNQTWPVGSGTFQVVQDRGGMVQCQPNAYASPSSAAGHASEVSFQPRPGSDARDLDAREPVVRRVWSRKAISFLATRGMQIQRLPWSRRYVALLSDPLALQLDRADIAAVVAESEAEPCSDLGWSATKCGSLGLPLAEQREQEETGSEDKPREPASLREPVVMVLASDPDGTRIAERIASRASTALGTPVGAKPVEPLPFYAALGSARALVFVVAIPLELEATCLAPSELVTIAPWLLEGWDHAQRLAHPSGGSEILPSELEQFLLESKLVVPILRTGASLVSRPGLAGIRVDGDGIPHFRRAGWEPGAAFP